MFCPIGKMTVFEGGTRVRAFVNAPGIKPYVNDGMFHAVDYLPTILNGIKSLIWEYLFVFFLKNTPFLFNELAAIGVPVGNNPQ